MDIPMSMKNCSVRLLNISCVNDRQIIALDMNPHPEELHGDNAATEEIKEKFSCDDNGVCIKEEDDSSSEDYSTMDEEGDTCGADEENVENEKQIHKGEQLPVKTHVVLQGNSVLTRSMAAAAGKQSKGKENKPLYCADPDDNSDSNNFLDDIEDDSSSNLSMDANSSDSNSDDESLLPSAKKFKGKGTLDNSIRTSGTSKRSKFLVILDKRKCKGVIIKAEGDSSDDPKKPHLSSTLSTLPESVSEKELEDPASKEDKDSVDLKRSYEICQTASMKCPEPSQLEDKLIPPPPSLLGAQQSNDPVTLPKCVSPAGKSSSGLGLKGEVTQPSGRSSVEDKSVNHMASTSEASGREDRSSGHLAPKPQTSMGNKGEVKRSEVPPKNDDPSSSSSSDSKESDLHSNDDLMEEEKEKGRLDNIIGASGTSGASNSPVEHGKRKCIVVIKRAEGKGTLDNFIGTSGTSVISNSCEDYRKGKGMLDNFIRTSGTSGTSNSPVERDKRKCIVVIKKAEGKGTLDNFIRTSGTSRTSNSPVKPDIRKCTVVIKKAEKPHLSSTLSTLPESVSEKELEDPSSKEDKDSVDLKRSYEICQTASMKCPEPSQLEDKLIPPPPSLLGAQQSNDPVTLPKCVSPAGKSSSGLGLKGEVTQPSGRSSVEDKSVNHMASTSEASGREDRSSGHLAPKPQTSMGNKEGSHA
ncbi:serine-rich adhesin for platelets-like isoform X2 [Hetaerina americana]